MKNFPSLSLRRICMLFLVGLALASTASAQPTFSKTFTPNTIGPGSVSTLQFNISTPFPVRNAAFTDVLPPDVAIADPANPTIDCTGSVSAPAGGNTITLSSANIASSCQITVDVTSSTVGTHTNTTSDLSWEDSGGSSGTSPPAVADLIVATDRPGFTKSFSPSVVFFGDRTTLTFTIDNSLNGSAATNLTFTDNLPTGMEIASPALANTDCTGGLLTAPAGGSLISYAPQFPGDASVAAASTCTITVDVLGNNVGSLGNTTSELTSTVGFFIESSGRAAATLTVTFQQLVLEKSFLDDPVAPGSNVTLEFTIRNLNRTSSAENIAFTDDLDAALSGLAAVSLPGSACGGSLTGTSFLTFSGGSLAAEATCTFSATLLVPAGAATGAYLNTTSSITADVGGRGVTGDPASELLLVQPVPTLTKTFLDASTLLPDPVVAAGDPVILRFTVANTSATSGATSVAFTDELTTFLPSPIAVVLPADPCGGGSLISLVNLDIDRQALVLTGGTLAAAPGAGSSCSFDVTLTVPAGLTAGTYVNLTEPVTATIDGATITGNTATDSFDVVIAPNLSKEFTDDPVAAGDPVTLEFSLSLDPDSPADATNITFTDDLTATLAGLAATGLPLNDVCGPGNGTLTGAAGDTQLTFAGGTLSAGEVCTFSVTLNVPGTATAGAYTNTTSVVMADVLGLATTGNPASDDLQIAGLTFSKEFTDDPVAAGGTVTLEFTIENISPTEDASGIFFTDNLGGALTGLASNSGTLNDVCGPGSQISGTSFLIFIGGNLTAGTQCTFSVTLDVPGAAADGTYLNVTSNLTGTVGGTSLVFDPAVDALEVDSNPLTLIKEFTDDPVSPGDPVTLRFTLQNSNAVSGITDIAFTDDLDAALSGLVATGLPISACGGTATGTSTISFSGGSLAAGETCSFDVTLAVPADAPLGTTALNVTSEVTGQLDGIGVSGDPATDELVLDSNTLTKFFSPDTAVAGDIVSLMFTLSNLDPDAPDANLAFSDDLETALAGLVPLGLPLVDVCGAGSLVSTGSDSTILFSGGILLPSGSCSFTLGVQIPEDAAPGDYLNVTSELRESGLRVADPATAPLTINLPPGFSKSFSPDTIDPGTVSTLTLVIDNSGSPTAANELDFTDVFPAGLVIADPANGSTTCSGGTLTAAVGSDTLAYSGGSVAASASCSIQVDVTTTASGTFDNVTGDLTSSLGNSGTATATLTVNAPVPPTFTKGFSPDTIDAGTVSTLTLTIDNAAGTVAANDLDFTDVFPAGLVIADPANASTTCSGGTLTANAGTDTASYTGGSVAAGASCSVQVDVTSNTGGSYNNVTGDLTSSSGNSGTASATLTVIAIVPPTFAKSFSPDAIDPGAVSTLTLTIDNAASTVAADDLDFTDVFPADLVIADPANASTTCSGGTLTADAGTDTVSYTGGSVAAGSSCSVQVDVTSDSAGTFNNVTGDLTSSLGNSGTASATLTVNGVGADLSVTKEDSVDPVRPGETLVYTITVTNNGPEDASRVVARDRLRRGVTLVATDGCRNDPRGVPNCRLGTIEAGTSKTYTIEVVVDDFECDDEEDDFAGLVGGDDPANGDQGNANRGGCRRPPKFLNNVVKVRSRTEDPDGSNNKARERTEVDRSDDDDEDSDSEDSDSEDSDSEDSDSEDSDSEDSDSEDSDSEDSDSEDSDSEDSDSED